MAVIITLVFSPALPGQEGKTDQPGKKETDDTAAWNGSNFWIALLIGLLGGGGIIAIIQFFKRIKDAEGLKQFNSCKKQRFHVSLPKCLSMVPNMS
jgi:hypothetical protein